MNDELRRQEALFRYSVLGPLLSRRLKRGEVKRLLQELAKQEWVDYQGLPRVVSWKTLEGWYYRYRNEGFEGLMPRPRSDRGSSKALRAEIRDLIVAMKQEDPGRSAPLIKQELERNAVIRRGEVSLKTIQRLLRREGLSRPKLELERPERLRWQASAAGELWQVDCCHGPKLHDPATGRVTRAKIFALLDDRSRLVAYLRASFQETQEAFLRVLLGAVQRRGVPRSLFADQHKSFTGSDTHVACARLKIRLVFARPYDGPAKGKIERFWRTLRAEVLDRLDFDKVQTIDDLNVRLSAWVEGEYNHRPHAGLGGRTPLDVWEEDAEQIRWVDELAVLEKAFTNRIRRTVRNDSTVQIRGRHYEAPSYLRGAKVSIGYSLLRPEAFWIEDGPARLPLRELDVEDNADRPRRRRSDDLGDDEIPFEPTGLNAVEDLLRRLTRPHDGRRDGADGEEGDDAA